MKGLSRCQRTRSNPAAPLGSVPDAGALLRAWARQQQLSQGADSLNSTVLTMMLVHLVEMGQVVSCARWWSWRAAVPPADVVAVAGPCASCMAGTWQGSF